MELWPEDVASKAVVTNSARTDGRYSRWVIHNGDKQVAAAITDAGKHSICHDAPVSVASDIANRLRALVAW